MPKRCKRCDELKPLEDFSEAKSNKDGHGNTCKPCVCARNKEYWRTPIGRMSQIFATQVSCSNQRKHPLPTYTRSELTAWANTQGLGVLWKAWKDSGYAKDLIPSVDRNNPTKGYSLDNIRLVTWTDNNDKAYEDRKSCAHVTKQNRKITQRDMSGNFITTFDSISSAARQLGITRVNINDVCRQKVHCKTAGGFIWEYAT